MGHAGAHAARPPSTQSTSCLPPGPAGCTPSGMSSGSTAPSASRNLAPQSACKARQRERGWRGSAPQVPPGDCCRSALKTPLPRLGRRMQGRHPAAAAPFLYRRRGEASAATYRPSSSLAASTWRAAAAAEAAWRQQAHAAKQLLLRRRRRLQRVPWRWRNRGLAAAHHAIERAGRPAHHGGLEGKQAKDRDGGWAGEGSGAGVGREGAAREAGVTAQSSSAWLASPRAWTRPCCIAAGGARACGRGRAPCGAWRCSSRTTCCTPSDTTCPTDEALAWQGGGAGGCAGGRGGRAYVLERWAGERGRRVRARQGRAPLALIAKGGGRQPLPGRMRSPSPKQQTASHPPTPHQQRSRPTAHLGSEAQVAKVVGANHEPDTGGRQAARPLPVLQPPQQVRGLVAADGGDERTRRRALPPGCRIVAILIRRIVAHAGTAARLENAIAVQHKGDAILHAGPKHCCTGGEEAADSCAPACSHHSSCSPQLLPLPRLHPLAARAHPASQAVQIARLAAAAAAGVHPPRTAPAVVHRGSGMGRRRRQRRRQQRRRRGERQMPAARIDQLPAAPWPHWLAVSRAHTRAAPSSTKLQVGPPSLLHYKASSGLR